MVSGKRSEEQHADGDDERQIRSHGRLAVHGQRPPVEGQRWTTRILLFVS